MSSGRKPSLKKQRGYTRYPDCKRRTDCQYTGTPGGMYYRTLIRRLKSDDFLAHFSKCVSNGGDTIEFLQGSPSEKLWCETGSSRSSHKQVSQAPEMHILRCAPALYNRIDIFAGAEDVCLAPRSLLLSLSVSLSLSLSLPLCLCFCLPVCLSTYLSICPPIYLSIYLSFFLSIYFNPPI